MSLVELMVGITVGLFIVAAATTLMANQLTDNRKLLVETQIQQDLRATMDIVTRQLRRAGALDVLQAQSGLGTAEGVGGARSSFTPVTPTAGASSEVGFAFYRNAGDQGPYGFKLEAGGIKSFSGGGWQELTDVNVLKVTAFSVSVVPVISAKLACPKLCSNDTASCWPEVVVRDYTVTITAEAKNDASVQRSMTTRVRLRNDWVRFNDAFNLNAVCPS